MANGDAPPRIYRMEFKARNRRVFVAFIKVPYGQLMDLNVKMARLLAARQITRFRVDVATPEQIAEHRDGLARWYDALARMALVAHVDLNA